MLKPSWPEIVLLLVLACGSVYGFWWRFRPVWRRIIGSKQDADFHIQPIGKRMRDFVWEVMLQAKVIRERPLPGVAHALVFWGFCAFGLITINHVLAGLGFTVLSRDSLVGKFYFYFAALFAMAVAISITGLAVRRFVVRPRWLGEVSRESGIIALLILTLMVTYLAAFWVADDSLSGKLLWWCHTLALLTFLPLIPHTKHLHLVLSPATVLLSRGGFSRIPPLVGDEDFGIDTGRDITQLTALQAFSCVECGRCTEHCPANNTGKVLNPKLIALGVRDYLNQYGPQADQTVVGATISQEAIFQCTTCGACEYQCPVGIEHLPMIIGLRRASVNTGRWDDDYGTKLFLNLERNGNPMGFSSTERDKFIQKQEFPIYDGTQEYLLWLGCMGAYDPQGKEIIASFAKVMRHLRTTFGVLRKERCTGDAVRRLGNDLLFGQLAETNLETFKQNNVSKIVSICPHCVRTISEDWKEVGQAPPIEHHSVFMARNQSRLPSNGGNKEKVVFHDPCYLGRYRGIYEEPRQVIALSATSIDPPRARERSFCCGAGGGLAFLGEEKGKRVNVARAEELVATGAGIVGTACPFCNTMFRDALGAASASPPRLLDIAQIAAASISSSLPQ